MMKQLMILCLALVALGVQADAQDNTGKKKKTNPFPNFDFKNRANDHLLIQLGYDAWSGAPDTIQFKGINRHFNIYAMYDMPFKTNPRWSVAIGAGVGTSNIYFDKTEVDLKGRIDRSGVTFYSTADTNNYKKYKMATAYLEAPVELRWVANPMNTNKSFKVALGVKVGTIVSAGTKGKNLLTENGQSIYGNRYINKEKDRKFLNSTRFTGTMRIGYGNFGLHGYYSIVPLFKSAAGPAIRPWGIGLTISGL